MQYGDFIDRVKERASLASFEEAERLAKATLSTLAERLENSETGRLAAQLPHGLKEALQESEEAQDTYDLEEFYNRVSARANIGFPDAIRQARIVMSVLCEAVSAGEMRDVLDKLPNQFRELFGSQPSGPLSPTTESAAFQKGAGDAQSGIEWHCPT